ncbi:MAG TPA: transcriptional regulator [Deinococcales bacterium]|nr:transcriptional regulator [Deinococcales bacterium]
MDPTRQAEHDAEAAMRLSFVRGMLNLIRREPNELLPFEAVKGLKPHGERYLGLQAIEVAKIIGSTDRYRDFDQVFLPRNEHLVDRWVNVRRLKLEGRELPPIQVYKVGETYFVKDGNHRVSVAHMENQAYIDAEVIELDVTVPPEAGDDVRDLILKGEYASFLETTKLDDVRPDHYPILFSTLGRYDLLLEHIRTRRYYLGLRYQRDVSWAEAVGSWYDRLYKRMVDEVRAAGALRQFPTRTEADLYLWMMDHRYYLNQRYGRDPGSRETVREFTRNYRPSWFRRFTTRFSQRLGDTLEDALQPGLSVAQRAARLFGIRRLKRS